MDTVTDFVKHHHNDVDIDKYVIAGASKVINIRFINYLINYLIN